MLDGAAIRRARSRRCQRHGHDRAALEPPARRAAGVVLRSHRPGDIGWVVSAARRALCAANMAGTSASKRWSPRSRRNSSRSYDASREHCWIAEVDGEPVGSVFLVKASDEVAKLRLLLVEKKARGLGVGRALVDECIAFRAGMPAIARSRCGRRASWSPRAESIRAPAFARARERHHSFGPTLSARPGSWSCRFRRHSGMVRRTDPEFDMIGRRFSDVQLHIVVRRFATPRNDEGIRPTRPSPSAGADARPAAA